LQLTLPRAAVGWLFAIISSNYNRISIHELGIAAISVTTLVGLCHFLSPFQMVFGRLADRRPILGFRRSPYALLGLLLSATAVAGLPAVGRSAVNSTNSAPSPVAPFDSDRPSLRRRQKNVLGARPSARQNSRGLWPLRSKRDRIACHSSSER